MMPAEKTFYWEMNSRLTKLSMICPSDMHLFIKLKLQLYFVFFYVKDFFYINILKLINYIL
jgi:hypothetical protein